MVHSSSRLVSLLGLALASTLAVSTANAQWSVFGSQNQMTNYTTGRVYVGTQGYNNTAVRFDVVETCELVGRDIAFHSYVGTPVSGARSTAIWGESNNAKGRGVVGFHFSPHGQGYGVWGGTTSQEGTGVFGSATHASGESYAGAFKNSSANGVGVYATAGTSRDEGDFSAGVWGNSASRFGFAGYFTGGSSYFDSRVGIGTDPTYRDSMLSVAGFVFGPTVQVLNWSNETLASGISAQVGMNGAMFGVAAVSATNWNEEENGNGNALAAYAVGGTALEVFVENQTPGNFAGKFGGNVQVIGSLSKGAGSFMIDHPLDPENKLLYHSFVESPDMMNVYNGNVTTDADGYATITMPDWFEALNKDFRYQVSVIDESAPDMHFVRVAQKLSSNRFMIKSIPGNLEVSWQITGIRHDAYANKNRIPVEVEKGADQKGLYLHPSAFGVPAEKDVNARRLEDFRSQKPEADADPRLSKPARKVPDFAEPVLDPVTVIPERSSGN